jgi:hypothetical protein
MAQVTYKDRIGVSEWRGSQDEALRLIGKQDEEGRTISICYIRGLGLTLVPLVLKLAFFLLLFSLVFFRQPFAWLPDEPGAPPWIDSVREWNLFSWGGWILALLFHGTYTVLSTVKSSICPGLPGAEIHFARYRKIVQTVRPGQRALILDWRVQPYAVVSTKPIAVEMPPVEGNTRDNISLTFRGALVFRVADTYRLLVEGGLAKFVEQLKRSYESIVKDLIIGVEAKDFNRFLIEEVRIPQGHKEDVSKKLEQLGKTDLTIEFLTALTEIDEVDVAGFDLTEPAAPRRRLVLDGLRRLAETYGIELLDHLPLGNATSDAYLRSLALPLANSITRLEQSTDTLREITEEEISEEILANVADKEIGVLEVQKIIKEIESITATLRDPANERSIVQAKSIAMENAQQSVLHPQLSQIEALIAQVQAWVLDTAGLERYMAEVHELLDWLEREVPNLAPTIGHILVERADGPGVIPEIDIVDRMLEATGTQRAFDALRSQAEHQVDYSKIEEGLRWLESKAEGMEVEAVIERTRKSLDGISSSAGISTEAFSTENVRLRIDEIARAADVELGAEA